MIDLKNKIIKNSHLKIIKDQVRNKKDYLFQYLGLIAVLIIFSILTNGRLFSLVNLKLITKQLVVIFTISVGVFFVYSHGGMDISIGSVVALCAIVLAKTLDASGSLLLGLSAAVIVSVAAYLLNVYLSIKLNLMSTISSLAIMFIVRGIVTFLTSSSSEVISTDFDLSIFRSNEFFIVIYMLFLGITLFILFNYTKIGKVNRAIGDNPLVTVRSGVDVDSYKVIAYVIAGVAIGLSSIFYLSRSGTVSEKAGLGMEMDAILALVLGGMSLSGGSKSRISSAVLGSITYCVLNNGLILAQVPTEVVGFAKGIIFLVIITLIIRKPRDKNILPR